MNSIRNPKRRRIFMKRIESNSEYNPIAVTSKLKKKEKKNKHNNKLIVTQRRTRP